MDQLKPQLLECDGLEIAASFETYNSDEHPLYYPSNVLLFMRQGQFNLKLDQQLHVIPKGAFALVRKYTHGKCFKTWSKEEEGAVMLAFALHNDFIRKVIKNFPVPTEIKPVEERFIPIPDTPLLKGLIHSLLAYFSGREFIKMEPEVVEMKTKEALYAILQSKPELVSVFYEYSMPERADLEAFMQHNFTYNLPLEKLAKMSGRSLSTFNREFRKIFNDSPHKWMMKERLKLARQLLVQTDRSPSDIYLDVGFEDLAHFSRSFKSLFGKSPSEFKRSFA